MEETAPFGPTGFPPPFCEVVEKYHSREVDLAYEIGRRIRLGEEDLQISITVARQHRTCTGFAFQPSHPGAKRPGTCMELNAL